MVFNQKIIKTLLLATVALLLNDYCFADSVQEQQSFTIRAISPKGQTVRVGNRRLDVNGVFYASDSIEWEFEGQEIRAVSNTGKPYIFSKEAFESKGVKTPFSFFIHGAASSRSTGTQMIIENGTKDAAHFPEKRIALIIANANYDNQGFLKNTHNDAFKIKNKLLTLGFDVMSLYDCTFTEFKTAINQFYSRCVKSEYEIALVYFTGHGLQDPIDGTNYLLPVEIDLLEGRDCLKEAISVNSLVSASKDRGIKTLFFFDACRNEVTWAKGSVYNNQIEAPDETCIMYSTTTGKIASDGEGDNSPFALAFLNNIGTHDSEHYMTLELIKQSVIESTEGSNIEQSPRFQNGFRTPFYFYSDRVRVVDGKNNTSTTNRDLRNRLVFDDEDEKDPHTYVDLGLSVYWATCNIGATSPEEYGDYYAWGELGTYYQIDSEYKSISLKSDKTDGYSWYSYSYCNLSGTALTKYCNKGLYGNYNYADYNLTLELKDDVANELWGGNWRIPTKQEVEELVKNCNWRWATINGVNGYIVTSKKAGFTDKSIFLPAAGYVKSKKFKQQTKCGYYWTGTVDVVKPNRAWLLLIDELSTISDYMARCLGLTVRAVYPK